MTFCTTTISPNHAIGVLAVNNARCAIHMAMSSAAPAMPSCTVTAITWLCGLAVTSAPGSVAAARRNSVSIVPVPWPSTGACKTKSADRRQNSSRCPAEVCAPRSR